MVLKPQIFSPANLSLSTIVAQHNPCILIVLYYYESTVHLQEIQGTALQTFGTNNQEIFHCAAHTPVHILVHTQHMNSLVDVAHLGYFPVPMHHHMLL